MSRLLRFAAALTVAGLVAAACDGGSDRSDRSDGSGDGGATRTVTLMTHDSFAVSDEVLAAFTDQTGIEVELLPSGDAGAALNQAILTKDDPVADAFFGVDTTFLTRALDEDVFAPYEPPRLDAVSTELARSGEGRLTPIDYGDVCVNADKAFYDRRGTPIPATFEDLADPAYKDQLVVENPATSSPGLAFLLATAAEYGEDGWPDYWRRLRDNGVQVTSGWEEAYNVVFSGSAGKGPRPLVVSYASSPPAEVIFAEEKPDEAPTAVLPDTCFRQVEYAGVLANAAHPKAAQELIDFMLSPEFQRDVPLQMFVFPVVGGTPLPPEFEEFAVVPENPASLDPKTIAANREAWIDEWTSIVLG